MLEEDSMKKVLIGTALLFAALPLSLDGVTPTVSKAHAIIGRPLTPLSVAGVHRRAMRRTYGVGANLGYHPVARAAAVGAVVAGAGYYGAGYGGWGYPAYGYGSGYGGWGYPAYAYGTGYSYPAYGYGTGYSYPSYGYGYGTGYSYPAYGAYRSAYHPAIRRHIYATAAGVHHYRHWH